MGRIWPRGSQRVNVSIFEKNFSTCTEYKIPPGSSVWGKVVKHTFFLVNSLNHELMFSLEHHDLYLLCSCKPAKCLCYGIACKGLLAAKAGRREGGRVSRDRSQPGTLSRIRVVQSWFRSHMSFHFGYDICNDLKHGVMALRNEFDCFSKTKFKLCYLLSIEACFDNVVYVFYTISRVNVSGTIEIIIRISFDNTLNSVSFKYVLLNNINNHPCKNRRL